MGRALEAPQESEPRFDSSIASIGGCSLAEHAAPGIAGWQLLSPECGIAWIDVEDPAPVCVQRSNVGDQIDVHETGPGDGLWALLIPDDLDELSRSNLVGREVEVRTTQTLLSYLRRLCSIGTWRLSLR
jgi:hypothetical protein